MQAEARVDALVQNTAQFPVPLEDQQILHPGPPGGDGGGQARRASADNGKLYVFHHASSLVRPVSSRDVPPFFVSSVWDIPSSRARISMTRGVQKPPWHRPIPDRTRRFTPSRDGDPVDGVHDLPLADALAAAHDVAVSGVLLCQALPSGKG